MNHFSGMSTGTTLGKGIEEVYQNKNYLDDIGKIRDFINENTGFKIEKISAKPQSATLILRAKTND